MAFSFWGHIPQTPWEGAAPPPPPLPTPAGLGFASVLGVNLYPVFRTVQPAQTGAISLQWE
jgi:hypothetical protein